VSAGGSAFFDFPTFTADLASFSNFFLYALYFFYPISTTAVGTQEKNHFK